MSVQLIVYPQNYKGFSSSISSSPSEFVVDGNNFAAINTSTLFTILTAPFPQKAIDYYAPTLLVNQWDRYASGLSFKPIESGGSITFPSGSAPFDDDCGIIQKLSNVTIGTVYTVTLEITTTSSTADLFVNTYNGVVLNSTSTITQSVGTITLNFTANATEQTILIGTSGIGAITLSSFSITSFSGSAIPSGAIQLLGDGQVICDLYEDEDLPLTLSVDDFKNVAEKVQSYSKAFNLPSTKRNNKIFNAIFEVTRSDDGLIFNPYKRTQCVLKQDGFILFEGYLRMLDVTDKEGEISYNVNLYSEVIALADTLKDRAFRDLDFTELEHDYNRTQIQNSWNDATTGITYTNPSTSGFRDAYSTVKYPFVDWDHQIIVADNPGGITGATDGNPEYTDLEQIFRPFISIKYLIDRIFEASDFTFTSAFFNTTDFGKLYMDFNWGADNVPFTIADSGEGYNDVSTAATGTFTTMQTNDNDFASNLGYSAGVYTAIQENQSYNINYAYGYNVDTDVAWSVDFRWKMVKGGVTSYINTSSNTGVGIIGVGFSNIATETGVISEILNIGDTLQPEFMSSTHATNTLSFLPGLATFGSWATVVVTNSSAATNGRYLQTLRGELGQWDFLKGLITMFNLVTLVDEDNPDNIIIEPYSDVFIPKATGGTTLAKRGVEHDWTDKIDVSEMKLTPLTDLNKETIFKFVEDEDDYSFNQYKNQVGGHLYGSKKFNAGNEFNILDGEEEIVAEPFAATVVKPLMDQFPQFITPAIYARGSDGVWEGFENSPRIMYNNGIKDSGTTYYIPVQNGVTSTNESNFLQFSHLSDIPTLTGTRDFHFGECQLMPGVGAPPPNNLFNTYWLPYYSELYNPNTRTMTIKVNLNPADINTFKFNDRVFIKNRVFRVNKIDYKPNDLATVEFILIP